MDFILEIYKVERAALDTDILGGAEHLALRQARSKPVMGGVQSVARGRAAAPPAERADGRGDQVRAEPPTGTRSRSS